MYALGLLMAFYGPNAMLIGNVGSRIWAYKSIKNIKEVMMVLFVLYDIDVLSVLINTLVLAKSGKVNFIQYVLKFIRNYWMLLLLIIGFDLSSYFGFNDINLGMDMTTEFSWVSDEGRMCFINSSTELTGEEKELLLESMI